MNTFLDHQNWRYATKKYDCTKKISDKDLDFLKEAIRLTPSSYGLQPYKILIIEDAALRLKLQDASWGQKQVSEASHLIVFANYSEIGDNEVENYISTVIKTRNLPENTLLDYENFIKKTIATLSNKKKIIWAQKQTYIALGNLLNAAAELKIDSTPIEGFDSKQFNEILSLDKIKCSASVIVALGYRHDEDKTQFYKKVRKANEDLFLVI